MSESNSPYVGYSLRDVEKAEAKYWYIQIGRQFFDFEGECLWERDEAEHLFKTLKDGLEHMVENGTQKERIDARAILVNFRLLPLRFA